MLDELGNVIIFKNMLAKAIHNLIATTEAKAKDEQRRKELEEMVKQKKEIDIEAESLVRRELYCGLSFLLIQTLASVRLTFWELTWDVIEPISLFFTSFYFIAAYAFFLGTTKEPTFKGLFKTRFVAKQKQLMKARNFNMARYDELRRVFRLTNDHTHASSSSIASTLMLG